ncbi:hypothetical protein [Streptomyces murinus]|uniref:hypothetical protein n=1 Tax=Streptomyces murinus TaxID=33900 RepID=UPI00382FA88C
MTATEPDAEELCAQGRAVYERALPAGRTPAGRRRHALAGARGRRGGPPGAAARPTERIAAVRRRETRIARSMEPPLRAPHDVPGGTPVVLDASS